MLNKKIDKYSPKEVELIRDAMLFYIEEHIAKKLHGMSDDESYKCYNKLMEEFEQ